MNFRKHRLPVVLFGPCARVCAQLIGVAGFAFTMAGSSCLTHSDGVTSREWAEPNDLQWAGCPAPTRAVVGDGAFWVQASNDNVTCATPYVGYQSAEIELERKAQLHFVAGDYFLPTETGEYAFELPVCVRLRDQTLAPAAAEPGLLTVTEQQVLGRTRTRYDYRQSLYAPTGEKHTFFWTLEGDATDLADGLLYDGRPWNHSSTPMNTRVCLGTICDDSIDTDDVEQLPRDFDNCVREDLPRARHQFVFDGGAVDVEIHSDDAYEGLAGFPVYAQGVLGSTPFRVEGYWDLVMRASYRYDNARDFVIRFPNPIEGFCGLTIVSAHPYRDAMWNTEVFLIDCEGHRSPKRLLSADWSRFGQETGGNVPVAPP